MFQTSEGHADSPQDLVFHKQMIQASRVYNVSKNEVLGIIVINEKCINVTKKLNVGYVNLMIIACYTMKFIAVTLPTGVWLKQTRYCYDKL